MCLSECSELPVNNDGGCVANKNDVRKLGCLGAGVLGLNGTVDWGGDLVLGDEVAIGELDPACYTTFDCLPTPPGGINT